MPHDTTLERPNTRALTAGPPPLYRSEGRSTVVALRHPPSALTQGAVRLLLGWSGLGSGPHGRWTRGTGPGGKPPAIAGRSAEVIDCNALRRSGEPSFRRPQSPPQR